MNDAEYRDMIGKLQEALLAGKIDRAMYEQLKGDLQAPSHPSLKERTESGKESPSLGNDRSQAADDSSGQIARQRQSQEVDPVQKGRKAYPTVNRQTTQEHSGSSQLSATTLALPVREWLPAAIRTALSEPETSQLIAQIAVIIGVLIGFRAHVFEELANAQAFVWGIAASVAAAATAAVWLISRSVCQAGDQNVADTRMTFLFEFFATALLYVAGLFWMTTGFYFGNLVGEVLGGRFGHITPDGGAIVGAILGACRAASFFVNRES